MIRVWLLCFAMTLAGAERQPMLLFWPQAGIVPPGTNNFPAPDPTRLPVPRLIRPECWWLLQQQEFPSHLLVHRQLRRLRPLPGVDCWVLAEFLFRAFRTAFPSFQTASP